MKLNDYFKVFISNISLNPTRVSKIESAITNWENKFKNDDLLGDKFIDFYTQGSYSTNTGVRPKKDKEFDVDVVLVLDEDEYCDSHAVLHQVKDRIRTYKGFEGRVKPMERCVRIDYANDFHVDVVPAIKYGSHIKIPTKSNGEWTETNPAGFTFWCNQLDKNSSYYFSEVTKIIKHWRDENVGSETAPKSILLTTLVGQAFKKNTSIAESLVETLDQLINDLSNHLIFVFDDEDVLSVPNPSLESENLARKWTKLKAQRFLSKVEKLHNNCKEALEETDKEESITKWQNIFGSSVFPSELPEAANVAKNISAGTIFVEQTGKLNSFKGQRVLEHRFYGEEFKS